MLKSSLITIPPFLAVVIVLVVVAGPLLGNLQPLTLPQSNSVVSAFIPFPGPRERIEVSFPTTDLELSLNVLESNATPKGKRITAVLDWDRVIPHLRARHGDTWKCGKEVFTHYGGTQMLLSGVETVPAHAPKYLSLALIVNLQDALEGLKASGKMINCSSFSVASLEKEFGVSTFTALALNTADSAKVFRAFNFVLVMGRVMGKDGVEKGVFPVTMYLVPEAYKEAWRCEWGYTSQLFPVVMALPRCP